MEYGIRPLHIRGVLHLPYQLAAFTSILVNYAKIASQPFIVRRSRIHQRFGVAADNGERSLQIMRQRFDHFYPFLLHPPLCRERAFQFCLHFIKSAAQLAQLIV
ncbi:hypothetical protein D3C75_989040 [compost metagenome]